MDRHLPKRRKLISTVCEGLAGKGIYNCVFMFDCKMQMRKLSHSGFTDIAEPVAFLNDLALMDGDTPFLHVGIFGDPVALMNKGNHISGFPMNGFCGCDIRLGAEMVLIAITRPYHQSSGGRKNRNIL